VSTKCHRKRSEVNHRATELTEKGREHRGARRKKERKKERKNRICRIAFGGRIEGPLRRGGEAGSRREE
jgi:hypothetical protein